ncbi:transporter substrate-binding domain-containing protein [Paenibacillus sp. OSY-SE]|uniref:transporter substrate-binding domain-containing protein n=1 Tax=Paenibacillus sp. OSY-SE TaxID=1196323 RepID=UPI000304C07F|nr:transporter substrate-binding domain-containing protein [Paenibacillus sp. OSY-SE]
MRKMYRNKWFLSGMILMLAAFAVAGCGGKEAGTENQSGTGKAASTVETAKERGKLVIGVKFDTNLFGLKDPASGEVKGFDIDIAKAIATKLLGDESKLELKEVTSKTRIPMLQNGDIDAIIATMTVTEERKQQVDFTEVYYNAGQSLLVKKGSPIRSIDDVKKGVKVVAVKGSTSTKNVREKAPDAEVLEFENYQDAFTALKSGKGEVLTTDNSILFGMMKQDPNFEMVGGNFTDEPYGIAVRKGDMEFASFINNLLKEMKENGEYDKLYEQWMGEKPSK